ncbi:MAG: vitamin K epoxide reductase family protein [Dehalococcoidia bacterium]
MASAGTLADLRERWRVWLMLGLVIAGTVVSAYLVKVALDPDKVIACGPVGDCHTVQSSQYAEVAGVPVAAFGLLMYVGLLALVGARVARVGSEATQAAFGTLTFSLALGGVVYSLYLTYLELAVIHAICIYCVTSAAIITVVFVLAIPDAARRSGPA